jgi:hypothetical protein
MDGVLMTWDGTDSRFELLRSKAAVNLWKYNVNSTNANEATYGITDINLNGNSQDVIWDRILITGTTAIDGRIDYGTSTTVSVTATLEYDGHPLGPSDTLQMNNTVMSWDTDHYYLATGAYDIVALLNYYVNSSVAVETTYGITVVNLNSQDVNVIWDRILILTTSVNDSRLDVDTNAELRVTAQLEYDGHPLGSGDALHLDGAPMTWDSGDTRFELLSTQTSVGLWTYFVNTSNAHENTYGITVINLDGNSQDVIWDRIRILTTTVDDSRLDINTDAELRVTAQLEYDGHNLGAGDTLHMDGLSMTWDSGDGRFELLRTRGTVGRWVFFVNSTNANEASYGITLVNLNSINQSVIWDRIKILTTSTLDSRIDIDTQADIRVTAELEYDHHALGSSDTLYMNNTQMTWVSTYFQLQPQFAAVGLWNFFVNSSSAIEATYGITTVFLDGNNVDQIWDRIVFDIQSDDESPVDEQSVSFTITGTYDYDDTSVSTFQIQVDRNATNWYVVDQTNYTTLTDSNLDVAYLYNVSSIISEPMHSLTAYITNTETVSWAPAPNNAPVNEAAPILQNPDDTDNMYAKYRFYQVTTNHSDQDGFPDIDTVLLLLWDNGQSTNYWTIKFDEDANTFSIVNGSASLTLQYCSNVSSGDWLNITWSFKIDWDHADLTDVDAKLFVNDTQDSDTDWYEVDWDTETRLDYSVTPYLSDDRGNIDTNDLQGDGTVIYYGSSDDYPYANETDVWANHDESGSWSNDVDGSGAFTITGIGSSSSVRLNTYTFKVVEEGAGSGGTDLFYTTSEEDTFITDRIQVQTTVVDDARVDVDANSEIRVTLWLDYDDTYLGSGDSVTLDDTAMTWDSGNSWFDLSRTQASVGLWKFFVNSSSEATYGITAIDLNSQEIDIIWDRIQILTTTVPDSRLDVNANAELLVTAQLEYDGHPLASGDTLYMDDVQMIWDSGDSRFELLRTQASVGLWNYYVNLSNAYEATYGITLVDINGQTQDVVWDRIRVLTTTTEDGRIDYGTAADIRVTAELEYDGHVLGSADTLFMNGTSMSWVSSYFQLQPQFSQVGLWSFFVNTSSANEVTYGISVVNLDGKSVDQIWDGPYSCPHNNCG